MIYMNYVHRFMPHLFRNKYRHRFSLNPLKLILKCIELVGKTAERRRCFFRGLACISQGNCTCSLARLFFHSSKTISTMEQFAHGSELL